MELLRLLIEIQCGNVGAGKIIVRKFIPLVKKYSAKLKSEDAYDELLLVLWSTVLKIDPLQLMIISDGVIVSYIEKSIFRAYVRMAKTEQRRQIEMSIEELSEIQKFNYLCSSDCKWGCLSELYFSDLTKRESLVLKMYYELGYNTSEIASCFAFITTKY